jgi:hypothetical protein
MWFFYALNFSQLQRSLIPISLGHNAISVQTKAFRIFPEIAKTLQA